MSMRKLLVAQRDCDLTRTQKSVSGESSPTLRGSEKGENKTNNCERVILVRSGSQGLTQPTTSPDCHHPRPVSLHPPCSHFQQ